MLETEARFAKDRRHRSSGHPWWMWLASWLVRLAAGGRALSPKTVKGRKLVQCGAELVTCVMRPTRADADSVAFFRFGVSEEEVLGKSKLVQQLA